MNRHLRRASGAKAEAEKKQKAAEATRKADTARKRKAAEAKKKKTEAAKAE